MAAAGHARGFKCNFLAEVFSNIQDIRKFLARWVGPRSNPSLTAKAGTYQKTVYAVETWWRRDRTPQDG